MLQAIIEHLNGLVAGNGIAVAGTPSFVRDYAASAEVRDALALVDAPIYSARATSALYVDQRIELVEESGDWLSLVLKVPAALDTVSTAANPSVVHILSSPAPLTVRTFLVEGFPAGGDIPGIMKLVPGDAFEVGAGDTFIVPGGARAVSLGGPVSEARFLRFSGPAVTPITVSFEVGREEPRAVSFTDPEASGRQFFAALLLDLVRGTNDSAPMPLREGDLQSIAGFVDMGLSDDTHLVTKWKLAQLAGRISPARARAFFTELAASPHPNASRHAARVLARLEGGRA